MSPILDDRFWSKVQKTDSCWNWTGAKDVGGYGRFKVGRLVRAAHRLAYEAAKGTIPDGLQLDHLCRNRGCVNPDHVEAVEPKTNVLRGDGLTAMRAKQTRCFRGHELTAENLLPRTDGRRQCRSCWDEHGAERRRNTKSKPCNDRT